MFGQCLCGSVQFETNIHPEQITVCHCSMCRKEILIISLFSTKQIKISMMPRSWVKVNNMQYRDTSFKSDLKN